VGEIIPYTSALLVSFRTLTVVEFHCRVQVIFLHFKATDLGMSSIILCLSIGHLISEIMTYLWFKNVNTTVPYVISQVVPHGNYI
jgi:hypothetical protein